MTIHRPRQHPIQPIWTAPIPTLHISAPLRSLLRRQKNTRVLLAEVVNIDVPGRRVLLSDGEIAYDTLIVAAGSRHSYFGKDHWECLAPGLKTIEDATEIRRRILLAFEAAEREADPEQVCAWLTFVVVGGGPTGVELAGAEIAQHTLRHDFRAINPADARILLIEAKQQLLPSYPPRLAAKATASLARLAVCTRTGVMVTDIQSDTVTIRHCDQVESIPTRTVLWAAGVQTSPLARVLAKAAGAELDRLGRVIVQSDLSVPGHPEIFVIGDMAHCRSATGEPLPGLAPVAMQQGRYVARLIDRRLRDETMPPFHYKNRGTMATIDRSAAVADLGWFQFGGFFAWLVWLFVHLIELVQFQNRLLVLIQWAWNYFTRNRAARLITGENPLRRIAARAALAAFFMGREKYGSKRS